MNPPSSMIALDQDLPDRIIFQSLIQFMERRDVNWSIYPNDRDNLIIPPNTSLEVITKNFFERISQPSFWEWVSCTCSNRGCQTTALWRTCSILLFCDDVLQLAA